VAGWPQSNRAPSAHAHTTQWQHQCHKSSKTAMTAKTAQQQQYQLYLQKEKIMTEHTQYLCSKGVGRTMD
jgi:hypothetical protein